MSEVKKVDVNEKPKKPRKSKVAKIKKEIEAESLDKVKKQPKRKYTRKVKAEEPVNLVTVVQEDENVLKEESILEKEIVSYEDKELKEHKEEIKEVKPKKNKKIIPFNFEHKVFEFDLPLKESKKSFGIHSIMQNAFNERNYIQGIWFLVVKNILASFMVAYFLYVLLNINSFSLQRLIFSDAAKIGFILFLVFSLQDFLYILGLYMLNYLFGFSIRWRRSIAAYGNGELIVAMLILISTLVFMITKGLPWLLLVLTFISHFVMLFKTGDMSGSDDDNKKLLITIISITLSLSVLILFYPYIAKNLARIFEIMF